MPTSDAVLLPTDADVVLLVNDVGKVNGQNDVDVWVLGFPTVLDEQGDVEVSFCDLL